MWKLWNGRFDLLEGVDEIIKPLMTQKKMIIKFSKKGSKSSEEKEITDQGSSPVQLPRKPTTYQSNLLPKTTQQRIIGPTQEYIHKPQLPPHMPNVKTSQSIIQKIPEQGNRYNQNINQNPQTNQSQLTFDVHLPDDDTSEKPIEDGEPSYIPGTLPGEKSEREPKQMQEQ